MSMNIKASRSFLLLVLLFVTGGWASAEDTKYPPALFDPNPGPLTVINYISNTTGGIGGFICADGTITADPQDPCGVKSIRYPIVGDVFATTVDPRTGETIGTIKKIGKISVTAVFDVSFFGLTNPDWGRLPPTLSWTFERYTLTLDNGSVFQNIEQLPLVGRAFPFLDPVEDPVLTGTLALRMGGCVGAREIRGAGPYAGKIGTLCLNGTFTFDSQFNGKGVSNCTLAIHPPRR